VPWPEGNAPLPPLAANGLKTTDFFTWGEAWANVVSAAAALPAGGTVWNLPKTAVDALVKDPYNGMQFAAWVPYACFEANAVLAMAVDLQRKGIVDFADPDLENCYATTRQMTLNYVAAGAKNAIDARVSFDTTAQPPVVVVPPPVVQPPPVTPPPVTPPPPATGGTMTTILQGTAYILTPKITTPPGALMYGVKPGSWVIDKPDQAKLEPQGTDQGKAKVTANVDTTAEDITAKCDVFVDAAKTKTITISIVLSDILIEASAGTFDIAPVPAG